jgi:hypothetical protein
MSSSSPLQVQRLAAPDGTALHRGLVPPLNGTLTTGLAAPDGTPFIEAAVGRAG